jgi:hypothetical protein
MTSLLTATLLLGSTAVLPTQARSPQAPNRQAVSGQGTASNFALTSLASILNSNLTNYASSGRTATVFAPPSNVRDRPNGNIVCTITTRHRINVYRYYDNSYQWISTNACGSGVYGVIHISQIRF